MKATNGNEIKPGDKITTWGSQTVYDIVEIDGELYLDGVKPLKEVNCTPVIVN